MCAWLSVVIAGAWAGCTGSPGSTGPGRAAPAASPSPVFISTAAPDAPVGRQLTWFLRAVADLPWSRQVIQAHFDPDLLAHISPDELNSLLKQNLAAWGASVPSSGASLTGLLWQHPARDPVSLLAVVMTLAESPQSCSAEFPTLLGIRLRDLRLVVLFSSGQFSVCATPR